MDRQNHVLLTMRAVAWERAKGELQAYIQTFWPLYLPDGTKRDDGFEEADKRIQEFIKDFEDNCR